MNVVDLLIKNGAKVDSKDSGNGWTALLYASENGHAEVVDRLLNAGASINARAVLGWTPVILAAKEGRRDVLDLLLLRGGDLRDKNIDNKTAITFAMENIDSSPELLVRICRWPVFSVVIVLDELYIYKSLDTGNFITDLFEYFGDIMLH